MSTAPDFNEVILARKIRRVLDEGAAQVSDNAAERLAAARRTALARKKAEPVKKPEIILVPAVAGAAAFGFGPLPHASNSRKRSGGQGLQLWLPLVLLALSLFGIVHFEEQKRVTELARLDAEVLSDALPLDAYLDHGFNEYLARNR